MVKSKASLEEYASVVTLGEFAGNVSLHSLHYHIVWIIDTGASCHICFEEKLLHDIQTLSKPILVHLPNGMKLSTVKAGKVFLNGDLILQNVLFIPSFKYNMLSVKRIITDDIAVMFDKHSCVIQDQKTKKRLAVGNLRNLYILKQNFAQISFCNFVSYKNSSKSVVWHQRLGHVPINVLKHISLTVSDVLDNCIVCHKAKKQRLSFTSSSSRVANAFDLVHLDLWGPYKHKSLNNE